MGIQIITTETQHYMATGLSIFNPEFGGGVAPLDFILPSHFPVVPIWLHFCRHAPPDFTIRGSSSVQGDPLLLSSGLFIATPGPVINCDTINVSTFTAGIEICLCFPLAHIREGNCNLPLSLTYRIYKSFTPSLLSQMCL